MCVSYLSFQTTICEVFMVERERSVTSLVIVTRFSYYIHTYVCSCVFTKAYFGTLNRLYIK